MTGQDANGGGDEIEEIFRRAIAETLKRLGSISPEEREDNMAFDRAARTGLAFLRIAEAAATLAARKRKEQIDNEKDGAGADDDAARIDRDEQELKQRLDRYIDELAGGGAQEESGGAGAGRGGRGGDGL